MKHDELTEKRINEAALNILRKADELIAGHWMQGDYEEAGNYCMMGAIQKATNRSRSTFRLDAVRVATVSLVHSLDLGLTPGWELSADDHIIGWNDREGRSEEDVHLAFKRAIHTLES